ncbi:hypothetical protein ACQY0O_006880 [Thecaphora frezii]
MSPCWSCERSLLTSEKADTKTGKERMDPLSPPPSPSSRSSSSPPASSSPSSTPQPVHPASGRTTLTMTFLSTLARTVARRCALLPRAILPLPRPYASVSSPHPFQHQPDDSSTPAQGARRAAVSPEAHRLLIEYKRKRKMAEYESKLKLKAIKEGLVSVEELAAKMLQKAKAASLDSASPAAARSEVERRDAKLAAKIHAKAKAEARRKLETGQLDSNPNGEAEGPVKPLHKILDIEGLKQETPEKISMLWTGYHTLKGKLSAVIPTSSYVELIRNARSYRQFVLPLPREVVGGEEQEASGADASSASPQKQQGYEMQYLEWSFLPKPASSTGADAADKVPDPTAVLFTPLAEYKLRQEFAQPVLILTHYTDIADSKGIVLMRGEITGAADDEQPLPPLLAEEAEERKPSARISQADAQLLSMMMQRFYLARKMTEEGGERRIELLKTFHAKPEEFKVDELVKAAFQL